ncbi:hypothetical protein [Nocardia sp. XZ_19_385]|uniref:hypothetical protein n=1 Tax=Nocardia sp. XZ_19_385 TaxID=2769488 RepID=UPI0018902DB4|nr:hypothetical protein [Nocardia sp. XZ_19_385]
MSAALHRREAEVLDIGHRMEPATVAAPPPQRRAPFRHNALPITGPHPPLFAVLGAHGGAATSTLAHWWGPAADCGLAWPASPATTQKVVVAARLCMPGLIAAAERLREWHAGLAPEGVVVIGLVLSAVRPGRVPAPVRRYREVVTELVGSVYTIGWHDELTRCELSDLVEYLPFDPPPKRRAPITSAVPRDVHHAGAAIIADLALIRKQLEAQHDSEDPS